MREERCRLGVADAAVVRELRSLSTLENAWYSAEVARRLRRGVRARVSAWLELRGEVVPREAAHGFRRGRL